MIDRIEGIIKHIDSQRVVVNFGPLDLSIATPQTHTYHLGTSITLYTHLHWNQEQGPSLYGFSSELERTVFLLITDCSGVGNKIGLALLEGLSAEGFLSAVQEGNEKQLAQVNGIGLKRAEQIIVQLKHKVQKLISTGAVSQPSSACTHWIDIDQTLSSLNYSKIEISQALDYLKKEPANTQAPFDQLLRKALNYLSQYKR